MIKKKLSGTLVISIALHAALLIYISNIVLDKVLPIGEVSSVQINFENKNTTPVDIVSQPKQNTEAFLKPEPKRLPQKIEKVETPTALDSPDLVPAPEEPAAVENSPAPEAPTADETNPTPEAPTADETNPTPEPPTADETNPTPEPPTAVENVLPSNDTAAKITGAAGDSSSGVQPDSILTPIPGNKKISYPYWSRLRKQEGLTVIHYTVSADGSVSNVEVVKSSGYPFLDREVVNTVKSWKFKQLEHAGTYERPVQFNLKGDAEAAPSKLRTTN